MRNGARGGGQEFFPAIVKTEDDAAAAASERPITFFFLLARLALRKLRVRRHFSCQTDHATPPLSILRPAEHLEAGRLRLT